MILVYKGINIFYTDEGSGDTIVLLHGFLEDSSMWEDIIPPIRKTHRIITIDLLGHGKTDSLSNEHTMSDMATAVSAVLNYLKVETLKIIGHSMGGYVALAYAEKNEDKVSALCLMNSTYEADDLERKQLRSRANEMIANNFESMVRVSFANLFSNKSRENFKSEFEAALQIALKTTVQGYIAANEGMKNRKDQSSFFAAAPFKKAIILGKKDAVLEYQSIESFAKKHNITTYIFSEGHMSYIENKTELLDAIVHFVENK